MKLLPVVWFVVVFVSSLGNTAFAGQEVRTPPTSADGRSAQEWVGVRTSGEHTQALVLHVELLPKAHGTVDLPDFGALGIPAAKFALADGKVHFELVGDSSTAIFDGNLGRDVITGHWQENERSGAFKLHPSQITRNKLEERSVAFQSGDIRLAGTLLLPQTNRPAAAIVFVHGAGAETRQASLFLARHFAERNVAALIYDKRGTGQSSGDWKKASFEDLAGDVEAAVAFLKSQPEIDGKRIGLMGSSQGGWIAPMAATRIPDLSFVIVKSAAAVTPEQQELARAEIQMREAGDSSTDIAEAQRLYKRAIAFARSGQGWEPLISEIQADANKRWAFFAADTPRDYWFFDQIRLFFNHDPILFLPNLGRLCSSSSEGETMTGRHWRTSWGAFLPRCKPMAKSRNWCCFQAPGMVYGFSRNQANRGTSASSRRDTLSS